MTKRSVMLGILLATTVCASAQDRDTKVRNDKSLFNDDARWVYNDLAVARGRAADADKPLLVVLRCVT